MPLKDGARQDGSYVGRFAPSPSGPLHAGSLVAALASWLDARAHRGRWAVRIEDIDTTRCTPGTDRIILAQLAAFGMTSDSEPVRQSERTALYEQALRSLFFSGWAYGCACSRRDIADAMAASGLARDRHQDLVYPGTCRPERGRVADKPIRAVRCRTSGVAVDSAQGAGAQAEDIEDIVIEWTDRRLGVQRQNLSTAVGDFVLRRADGPWAYQLAVVVDDADQRVTSVVRGEDLADNTPRQIHLQALLGYLHPTYLHVPLVLAADGEKLSKQNGAAAIDGAQPLPALRDAGRVLGLELQGDTVEAMLGDGVAQWARACKLA